jgi:hypothetical protein
VPAFGGGWDDVVMTVIIAIERLTSSLEDEKERFLPIEEDPWPRLVTSRPSKRSKYNMVVAFVRELQYKGI